VKSWAFVLASLVGMAPGSILYVYLGYIGKVTLAGGGDEKITTQQWVLPGVGLVATAAVTVYLSVLAKKALKKKGAVPDK
jgi:uncharacterized membrane protein YdjX (TVP38/TMEM64 family)